MKLRWSREARAALTAYLDDLHAAAPAVTRVAKNAIRQEARGLGRRPLKARESRWAGLREWSLPRWKKLLVLRVDPDEVVILAFLDARQDLSGIDPKDD